MRPTAPSHLLMLALLITTNGTFSQTAKIVEELHAITSSDTLRAVVQQQNLVKNWGLPDEDAAVDRLRQLVDVTVSPDQASLEIEVSTDQPLEAERLTNAVTETYLAQKSKSASSIQVRDEFSEEQEVGKQEDLVESLRIKMLQVMKQSEGEISAAEQTSKEEAEQTRLRKASVLDIQAKQTDYEGKVALHQIVQDRVADLKKGGENEKAALLDDELASAGKNLEKKEEQLMASKRRSGLTDEELATVKTSSDSHSDSQAKYVRAKRMYEQQFAVLGWLRQKQSEHRLTEHLDNLLNNAGATKVSASEMTVSLHADPQKPQQHASTLSTSALQTLTLPTSSNGFYWIMLALVATGIAGGWRRFKKS